MTDRFVVRPTDSGQCWMVWDTVEDVEAAHTQPTVDWAFGSEWCAKVVAEALNGERRPTQADVVTGLDGHAKMIGELQAQVADLTRRFGELSEASAGHTASQAHFSNVLKMFADALAVSGYRSR